jgi:hypothetical protein
VIITCSNESRLQFFCVFYQMLNYADNYFFFTFCLNFFSVFLSKTVLLLHLSFFFYLSISLLLPDSVSFYLFLLLMRKKLKTVENSFFSLKMKPLKSISLTFDTQQSENVFLSVDNSLNCPSLFLIEWEGKFIFELFPID